MISNNYEELKTIQKKKVYGKKSWKGACGDSVTCFFSFFDKKKSLVCPFVTLFNLLTLHSQTKRTTN